MTHVNNMKGVNIDVLTLGGLYLIPLPNLKNSLITIPSQSRKTKFHIV